jgi:hypothetical protein
MKNYIISAFLFFSFGLTYAGMAQQNDERLATQLSGEWRPATENYEPHPDYPNDRFYYLPIDRETGEGIRIMREDSWQNGEHREVPIKILEEDNENRILKVQTFPSESSPPSREILYHFDESGSKLKMQMELIPGSGNYFDTYAILVGPVPEHLLSDQEVIEGPPIMVRVSVWDDTENTSIHSRAEIWFRGYGSWWIGNPLIRHGGVTEELGQRPSRVKHELIFYPDGRDGNEIKIPYMLTEDMNPDGSPRDTITISIQDSKIVAEGLPIRAATGENTIEFTR